MADRFHEAIIPPRVAPKTRLPGTGYPSAAPRPGAQHYERVTQGSLRQPHFAVRCRNECVPAFLPTLSRVTTSLREQAERLEAARTGRSPRFVGPIFVRDEIAPSGAPPLKVSQRPTTARSALFQRQ